MSRSRSPRRNRRCIEITYPSELQIEQITICVSPPSTQHGPPGPAEGHIAFTTSPPLRAGSARILHRLITDATDTSLPGIPHLAPTTNDAAQHLESLESNSQAQSRLVDSFASINSEGQPPSELSPHYAGAAQLQCCLRRLASDGAVAALHLIKLLNMQRPLRLNLLKMQHRRPIHLRRQARPPPPP